MGQLRNKCVLEVPDSFNWTSWVHNSSNWFHQTFVSSFGRKPTVLLTHTVYVLAGAATLMAPNFTALLICRWKQISYFSISTTREILARLLLPIPLLIFQFLLLWMNPQVPSWLCAPHSQPFALPHRFSPVVLFFCLFLFFIWPSLPIWFTSFFTGPPFWFSDCCILSAKTNFSLLPNVQFQSLGFPKILILLLPPWDPILFWCIKTVWFGVFLDNVSTCQFSLKQESDI